VSAVALVTVEFVGGPWEGQVREYEEGDLRERALVRAYPRWHRERLAAAGLAERLDAPPEPPPCHTHEYVLHRYGDRLEYVHDGRREDR
jgi:hypothetical protein